MRPAQLGVGPERPLNGYGTASTQGASRVSRAGRTPLDLPPLPSALLQPGSPLNAPGRGTQPLSCSRSGRPPPGGRFWARAGCRGPSGPGDFATLSPPQARPMRTSGRPSTGPGHLADHALRRALGRAPFHPAPGSRPGGNQTSVTPRKRHTGVPKLSSFTVPGGLPTIQTHHPGEK